MLWRQTGQWQMPKWHWWMPVSWGLYCKTLRIRNLPEMDRFDIKLLTFSSEKYTQAWTNTLAYYGVCRLRIRNAFKVWSNKQNLSFKWPHFKNYHESVGYFNKISLKKRARLLTCSLRLRLARPLRRRCRRRSSRLAGLNYNKMGRFGVKK
jgi:hypothetical protein